MARNSGVPVGYLSHFCSQLTCRWHWTPKAIWCWGFRLGAVELWFSRFRCLTFFWASASGTCCIPEGSSAPEILLSTVEFLGTSSFFELFFLHKKQWFVPKNLQLFTSVSLIHSLIFCKWVCVTPRLCSQRFFAGSLGPQTVVGSASFNLFCDPRHGVGSWDGIFHQPKRVL